VNQPKAKLPRNQSPAYPTGRRLQMASDGNECAVEAAATPISAEAAQQ